MGNPPSYIEPFFGSGAVLLNRPNFDSNKHTESICDSDGHIANVWRALQADPDAVSKVCDWPVLHCDLSARKKRLNAETLTLRKRLCEDEKYYNVELAGYWIWAASCWIGHGLICPNQRPHLGDTGHGVHKKSLRLGQIPHLVNSGKGVHKISLRKCDTSSKQVQEPYNTDLWNWFRRLSERLRYVRVVCGDWTRICSGNWQDKEGIVGIFFDPPYGHAANRVSRIYATDSLDVSAEVRNWCIERGRHRSYRIVLAGYVGEHEVLADHGWIWRNWTAGGGYSKISLSGPSQGQLNRHKEILWFSPHCCVQADLFSFISD